MKKNAAALPVYSLETYTHLIEQENEQLRRKNQQLQLRVRCLESKINTLDTNKRAHEEQAVGYSDALRYRDELVGEIAETIIGEFQRYKKTIQGQGRGSEEIKVYNSGFENTSPI